MRTVIKITDKAKALSISEIRALNPVGEFYKDYIWESGVDWSKIIFDNVELWFSCPQSSSKTYRKLSNYGYKAYRASVWASEEFTAPVHSHGQIVYSILCGSGNGGVYVWDENQKKVVNRKEFVN